MVIRNIKQILIYSCSSLESFAYCLVYLIVLVNFLKQHFKNPFKIVGKCVLVNYKYDLHVGRPRINENDPHTSIVLCFSSRIISVLIVSYFCSNSFLITLFEWYKKLEKFPGWRVSYK